MSRKQHSEYVSAPVLESLCNEAADLASGAMESVLGLNPSLAFESCASLAFEAFVASAGLNVATLGFRLQPLPRVLLLTLDQRGIEAVLDAQLGGELAAGEDIRPLTAVDLHIARGVLAPMAAALAEAFARVLPDARYEDVFLSPRLDLRPYLAAQESCLVARYAFGLGGVWGRMRLCLPREGLGAIETQLLGARLT